MISYLKGKIVIAKPGFAILEVSGIGYKVYINSKLELKENQSKEFYIYQYIREDRSDLFGFEGFEDLELFEKLISVNGVGPKVAMAIMTISNAEKIISAILGKDIAFFCSVPGIGKKVATKVILELNSKISGSDVSGIINKESYEVVEALVSLGYKKSEIAKVIQKMPPELKSDQDKIRWSLSQLYK